MSYGSKPIEVRHSRAALFAENFVVPRVQSLGYTADLNSEEVNELANSEVVEVVNGDPSVSLTVDINEYGSIDFLNQLSSSYIGQTSNTNTNDGTIDVSDFETASTDFNVTIDEDGSGAINRSSWFNNGYIESVSGTYQVDGFATESYSLSCTGQRWYLGTVPNVISRYVVVTDGRLDNTDGVATATVVTENGLILPSSYWGADTAYDITTNDETVWSPSASNRYRVLYAISTTHQSPSNVASPIGGVKEGEIEIVMWDTNQFDATHVGTDTSDQLLRVQSVDYEVSFDREDLKQLYTGNYAKGLNSTSITATISANSSDLEMWALASSNQQDWSGSDIASIDLSDFQSVNTLALRIDIFNTNNYSNHDENTLLKQIYLGGGKVTNVGDSFDVPGRGSDTMEITFNTMHYHGTGVEGR